MKIAVWRAFLAAVVVLVGSCGPPEPAPDAMEHSAEDARIGSSAAAVQIRLDSGNAAFRAGNLEDALRHYRAAADAAPGNPSAWFGVYMAHDAMGNTEAADSALERARRQVPGTAIMRAPADTTRQ